MDNLNIQAARAIQWDIDGKQERTAAVGHTVCAHGHETEAQGGRTKDGVRENAGQVWNPVSRCAGIS